VLAYKHGLLTEPSLVARNGVRRRILHTLVLASQKGGSGKTTLSGHLAVEAERVGAGPVALIDTDPQGSLAGWWNARESKTPVFVKVGSMELEDALSELRSAGIQLAIVDTPPAITGAISKVVSCADLVIVPTRPGPHDLRAVGATADIAERVGKPLLFVVNDATARARITSDAAIALSQHGTVAPITLHHRVDYAASMVDGRTVGEVTENSKSAQEIQELWSYISERLKKLRSSPEVAPVTRSPVLVPLRPSLVVADETFARAEDAVRARVSDAVELLSNADAPGLTNTAPAPNSEEPGGKAPGEKTMGEKTCEVDLHSDLPALSADDAKQETYDGAERRGGGERRLAKLGSTKFGVIERRNASPFGRRRSDRAV
jgi:chromosome partitioning protein